MRHVRTKLSLRPLVHAVVDVDTRLVTAVWKVSNAVAGTALTVTALPITAFTVTTRGAIVTTDMATTIQRSTGAAWQAVATRGRTS